MGLLFQVVARLPILMFHEVV